jgi:type I restriction enzyme, S subunit
VIPQGWKTTDLGDVAKISSGGTPDKANISYWNGDIPWVSAKDLKSFRISGSIDRVTELGAKCGTRLIQPGTIFVLVRGMTLLKDG